MNMNNIYKVLHIAAMSASIALLVILSPFFAITIPFAAVIFLIVYDDLSEYKEQMLEYIRFPLEIIAKFKEAL